MMAHVFITSSLFLTGVDTNYSLVLSPVFSLITNFIGIYKY